ncbi:MAG: hypothetical protein ACSHW1_07525 [Yoonia sp.]|uniref:hypothetical protein n=1 Tax=Yoonia sp. TaxID=2212373 RepID=UPI003EF3C9CB
MRRSRPSLTVFVISVLCAILAILPIFGISLVAVPISSFGLMTIAWVVLVAGVVSPRL